MNTILTDADRKKVFLEACGKSQFSGFDEALMILTEAAVLAKNRADGKLEMWEAPDLGNIINKLGA